MKIRNKINDMVNSFLNELETEINKLEATSACLREEIVNKTETLKKFSEELSVVLKDKTDAEVQIRQGFAKLAEAEEPHKIRVKNLEVRREELRKTIKMLEFKETEFQANLSRQTDLEKRIKSLETIKEGLEQEIEELSIDIISLKDKKETEEKSLQIIIKELKEKVEEENNKFNELSRIILPKHEELEAKEKRLIEKEKSLLIIEQRYKELYEAKGGGFKV